MMKAKEHSSILLRIAGPALQSPAHSLDTTAAARGAKRNRVVVVALREDLSGEAADSRDSEFIELCASCLSVLSEIAFETHAPKSARQSDAVIDLSRRRLSVAGCAVNFTPRELFFYTMFAIFRAQERNGDGTLSLNELTVEDFDITLRRITGASGEEIAIQECYRSKEFKFLLEMVEQVTSSSPKRDLDLLHFKDKLRVTFARIKRKIRDAGLPVRYAIKLRKERGEACYSLIIPPDKIRFIDNQNKVAGNVAGRGNKPLAA
ncbi:MAG TPA: hypothetical protein VNO14_03940 [Blastocatellia bacterium]|nr:hypothetical protein [Blastocatellia bacterium]